ncbi:MAG: hypothetical protein KGH49_04185, partial [Candidatus Micrarchaeota archaeon]|nr:hypothetical protein [Candidatus Micrarchaeota archaeon]
MAKLKQPHGKLTEIEAARGFRGFLSKLEEREETVKVVREIINQLENFGYIGEIKSGYSLDLAHWLPEDPIFISTIRDLKCDTIPAMVMYLDQCKEQRMATN